MSGSSGIVTSGYRYSLWNVAPINFISVSVCVSVCLSGFFSLYLGYYGLDFDQLGENVGTEVQWIVLKFENSVA